MSFTLVAVVFTAIAASVALVLTNREDRGMAVAIGAVWVVAAAFAFNLPQRSIIFVALGVMLAIAGAASPRGAVILFLGVFAALPMDMSYDIPFPGLNYLFNLDYANLATLVLLGPAFIRTAFAPGPKHLQSVERLLLFFALFTGVMSLRDLPFTSMMRTIFNQLVMVYIPFFVISRTIKTKKDMDWALAALFTSFMIIAMIGVISALRSWNYYAGLADYGSAKPYFDYRNGFLRVSATVIPSLLGFLCGAGFIMALRSRVLKLMPLHFFLACTVVFAFACFVTGARGGWIGAFLCITSYFVFLRSNVGMRKAFYVIGVASFLIGGYLVLSGSSLISDQYGTVSYRADLIRTSIEQVKDRPFFGSSDFLESARFAHLRQGEGIIDLVNGYIQIVLFYGLVGLCSFVGAHLLAMKGALKELSFMPPLRNASPEELDSRRVTALLLAMQIGYLALIGTISIVNQMPHYGYFIIALLVAHARQMADARNMAVSAVPDENEAALEDADQSDVITPPPSRKNEGGPVPYGARFVRRF